MEVLLLGSTIITSITLKKIHKVYFMNSLVKKNYKLDDYKYDRSIVYMIPLINIGYLIKNITTYRINNIKYLEKNNMIIPLTKKEKNVYEEYPNITTVRSINIVNDKSNMIIMDVKDNVENTLYVTNEGDNYHINRSIGPISKLPKKDQYEFLKRELESMDKPKVKIKK